MICISAKAIYSDRHLGAKSLMGKQSAFGWSTANRLDDPKGIIQNCSIYKKICVNNIHCWCVVQQFRGLLALLGSEKNYHPFKSTILFLPIFF